MKLYHITKVENIKSILENGIIPNYKKGITCGNREHTCVFLTNNINKVIRTQLGGSWGNVAIFEVSVNNAKPHKYYCSEPPQDSDFEFVVNKVDKTLIKGYRLIKLLKPLT